MRLLVVDDHEVVRRGVRSLLLEKFKCEVCGEAIDGQAAVEKARELKPDLIVMDVSMPRLNGLEATRQVRTAVPSCEVLILSQHESPEMIRQALKAGARGYVVKSSISRDLITAVDKVSRGEYFFDPAILEQNSSPHIDVQEILQRSATFEQALRESEQRLRLAQEYAHIGTFELNLKTGVNRWTPELERMHGLEPGSFAGTRYAWEQLLHPEDRDYILCAVGRALKEESSFEGQWRVVWPDGSVRWFLGRALVLKDAAGEAERFIGVNVDITEQKQVGMALDAERKVLERIVSGATLTEILETLTREVELQSTEGMLCSILLFDETSQKLRHGAAPSLPHAYNQAIDGIRIGPSAGSCGTAAFERKPIFVYDIAADPLWVEYKDLAATHGLAASCSTPVFSSRGRLLGTVAMYYRKPHKPGAKDRKLIEGATQLATVAIERKQADEEIRRSESRLRAAFRQTYSFLVLLEPDGTIIEANRAALDAAGGDAAQVVGRKFWEPWWSRLPDEAAVLKQVISRVSRGETVRDESYFCLPDGSKRLGDRTLCPVLDEQGKVTMIVATGLDITERKQTETATGLLASIVASSDDAIVSKNLDGIINSWNKSAERIFGYTADEAIGQHITLIIPPDHQPEEAEILRRLRRGERIDHFHTIRRRKDGTLLDVSLTISPVRDPSGRVIGASKVARDITAQKQTEKALQESEQRLRTITDATPIMVWLSGLDKLRYYYNKGWLDFVGRTLKQKVNNGWAENVHPEDFDRCLEIYVSSFDARRPFKMEYRLRHHTGRYRWILDCGVPRYTPDGTFEGYVGGCLDIHDQKEAAEKIRIADETLLLMKTQDEERRHIARELHDSAGQTLTVLSLSLAQLVHRAEVIAPELAKDGKSIEEVVQQLHREIRTTSYLLHPPLLDEAGLSSALSWYVQGVVERSGMSIDLKISDDLGRLPADMELAIFRVVQECLTNIHRHAESKTASIRVVRENGSVRIEVQDQGKGIPAERLAEIQSRNSGVGIRGIRERLRQFHGEMKIESNGSGTRVFASLPIGKGDRPMEMEHLRVAP